MTIGGGGRRVLLVSFGLISLAAVAIGAFVAASSGVPAGVWGRNIGAWAAGALLAGLLAAFARPSILPVFMWALPVGLAAAFLGPPQDGVHRWIDLGPLRVNAALFLTPAAVVALAGLAPGRRWPWIAALLALVILVIQPDASQATGLAAAAVSVAAVTFRRPLVRLPIVLAAGILAGVAWSRPDPLQPIAEVEGVINLAFDVSLIAAFAALLLLALMAVAPALLAWAGPRATRPAGWALSACLLAWILTPALGAFPVPLVGMGLSPIVGAWLGVGLLTALMKQAGLHGISTSPRSPDDTDGLSG